MLTPKYHIVTEIKNTGVISRNYTYGIRGDEENMDNKIVDLYYERKREEIRNKYTGLVDEKYEQLNVVKEYKELVNTFVTSLAEMADRYNLYHCGGSDHGGPMSGNGGEYAKPSMHGVTEEEYYTLRERLRG